MPVRKQALYAFAALIALAALVLFWGLGSGRLHIYDEGLYGMYGRTMLRYGVFLHVVDVDGQFPTGAVKFSKPPLSVWVVAASMQLFGPSLFALRLPFALASFAVTLVAFAFGRLIERGALGVWLGFAWGVTWLISFGTYEHGRTATIEPMLLAFVIAALYAYARALGEERTARALAWASAAGLAVSGAFFTKQLVCAIAVLPILVAEAYAGRHAARRLRLARIFVALGIPFLLAAVWLAALYAKVGFATFKVLWSHAIVRRVSGFDGVHHQNYLNRVAELLDVDAAPFSWALGVIGLGLLWFEKVRNRDSAAGSVLLVGAWFVCSWLAFDVGSRAILPWYALTLLPPLALGNAWLAVRAIGFVQKPAQPAADGGRLHGLIAASGAVAIALAAGLSALSFMPSLLAVAIALAAILYSLRAPARLPLLVAAFGCMLAFGTFLRDAYRGTDTDPLASLGHKLWERGKTKVSVAQRAGVHPYALTTFFGADAHDSDAPPWELDAKEARAVQARVESSIWPTEIAPRQGVQLVRDAGLVAWLGDLSAAPVSSDAVSKALERGALTFEAEHMASDRFYTLRTEQGASGNEVRRAEQRLLERAEEFLLAKARTPELPRGRYIATFWLKLHCTGYRGETLGDARVAGKRVQAKKKHLECRVARRQSQDRFNPLEVPFTLTALGAIDLELRASQGEVSLDRVTVRRDAAPRPDNPAPAKGD
jgi:4-amino-4-deoxy-L-arabinose transferase-like glycosyltransferase